MAYTCPHFGRCGGCQLLAVPYEEQLAQKQKKIESLMGRFCRPNAIWGMDEPLHYRHKVQAAVAAGPGGRILTGTYEPHSHRLVPVEQCLLEHRGAAPIFATLRRLAREFHLEPFDDRTGRGFLRHILLRFGWSSGEVMAVLVTASPVFPGSKNFVRALRQAHPEIVTVVQSVNARRTSMVLGEQEKVLYGPGFIRDSLCGLTFRLSARSFYQINPPQTQRLYEAAVAAANLTGRELVMDAYCGTGTIGLIAAAHAGQVLGVERSREAVRDAEANARRNGVRNIRFLCADAGEQMARWAADARRPDVVLLDPPRAGCSPQFLQALMHMGPKRAVYISCDPETQARDLAVLCDAYRVTGLQPVDLFPHTRHIECIAALEKRV